MKLDIARYKRYYVQEVMSAADMKEVHERISGWIKNRVSETKAKGVVLGLSGGIDSAVTAKLAVDAGVDVKALIMPDKLASKEDIEDAVKFAEELRIKYEVIPLDKLLDTFEFVCPSGNEDEVAWGNVKARLRMILLYVTANLEGRLVLGTGNRTELLLGYFTKYGDGGVDLLPIGGLYKTRVRELARYLALPEKIIGKTPSAGLWPGQTDEGELGMSYEVIDQVLHLIVDEDKTLDEAAEKLGVDKDKIASLAKRIESNQHKRKQPETPAV